MLLIIFNRNKTIVLWTPSKDNIHNCLVSPSVLVDQNYTAVKKITQINARIIVYVKRQNNCYNDMRSLLFISDSSKFKVH